MKKKIIVLAALSILGFISWLVYGAYTEKVSEIGRVREQPRVAVEIAPIQTMEIQEIGNFTGTLQAKSLFLVASKVAGRLKSLLVNVGDQLKPQQVIAVLDDDEYKQQFQQAQAYLEVAKANLEASEDQVSLAKLELEREQTLHEKKLIAKPALDKAKANYATRVSNRRVAKAQLEEKNAALESSRIRLSYTTISNIWSKNRSNLVIGERFMDEGALVGSTSPIVSVLDISSMVGMIHVTEMDYFKIRLGQAAEITVDALPERKFKGFVVRIAPIIKEKSREAQIDLEIPNEDGLLKPGLFIRASIRFSVHPDATVVPISALVKRENDMGVFLLDAADEKVNFIKIIQGFTQNEFIEIVSPSLQGSVITLGHHLLEDGSIVSIPGKDSVKENIKKPRLKAKPEQKKP